MSTADPCEVLLLGFEGQENLGLRSLAAYLERARVDVHIDPMQGVPKGLILERALKARPKIVGFSLIFQRMLDDYSELIKYLRDNGVGGHFTMGGHFPSFAFEEVLSAIPGLDSVVCHEGEETLLQLFRNVERPEDWKRIEGLAYRDGDVIRSNCLRPLIADLDSLPFPVRSSDGVTHRGFGVRSIAASRGCYYNCSFCSISEFYRRPNGALRRTRSPRNVVQEMLLLHERYGTRIFIFQDDDLFMRTAIHRQWLDAFLAELKASKLYGQILWRISCRVDDLDPGYILKMRDAGLVSLYLGIESASDEELAAMNKGYKSRDVYRAVDLLRTREMPFEFGFMLFTPDSSLATVRENIEFLHFVAATSDTLVHFCKMSPYAGTPIQRRLLREHRLEGSLACPDYRFLDPKLDFLQAFCAQTFNVRNFSDEGLVERLRFAKFDTCVLRRWSCGRGDTARYEAALQELIQQCNASAIDTVAFALTFIAHNDLEEITGSWEILDDVRAREISTEQEITTRLNHLMSECRFLDHPVDGNRTTHSEGARGLAQSA